MDLLVAPLVFGLIVVMLWLGGTFGGMVAEKSASKAEVFYDRQSMGEIIDAPCAVHSRGVFYRASIENGEFGCFTPYGTILLKFQFDGEEHRWAMERTESGVDVSESSAALTNPQTYPILVYDRDAGTKTPAVLEVSPG